MKERNRERWSVNKKRILMIKKREEDLLRINVRMIERNGGKKIIVIKGRIDLLGIF